MNTYTNPAFIPQLNDFGDDYYKITINDNGDNELLDRVKKIRRRYQDWFEYVEACKDYDHYMDNLIYKYGGKQNFKLALLLKKVNEYLPNYPEFRKTKKNRSYYKMRASRPNTLGEITFQPDIIQEEDKVNVKVEFTANAGAYSMIEGHKGNNILYDPEVIEKISSEIDFLGNWYKKKHEEIAKAKNKKDKKKIQRAISRRTLSINSHYKSLDDMEKIIDKKKKDRFFGRDIDISNTVYNSRTGYAMTASDAEMWDSIDSLRRIGVKFTKPLKIERKIIRKNKKEKKKNKKLKKIEKGLLNQMTEDDYDSFEQYQNDIVSGLDSSHLKREW